MDPMDDYNDATWHQAEQDEQRMLADDPEYFTWLRTYEEQP